MLDNAATAIAMAAKAFARIALFEDRRRSWSRRTFQVDSPLGAIEHLREELDEVKAEYLAGNTFALREELADLGLLYRDIVDRCGVSFEEHQADLEAKHEVNEKREWPQAVEGEPCKHVKGDGV